MSLSYLTRMEWGAVPPTKWNKMVLPITRVFNIATNTRECFDELNCIQTCQRIQSFHLMRNYGDIRFSFVIGGDGQVYEGRGWKHAPSLPREYKDRNQEKSILIAFAGRWVNNALPSLMMRASSDLIDFAIDNKYMTRDYRSQDLFHNEYKERVVAEIIRESRYNRIKRRARTGDMLKEMGLTNQLSPEIDTNYT